MPTSREARQAVLRAADEWVRSRIWRLEESAVDLLGQLYLEAYAQMSAQLTQIFSRYVAGEIWAAGDVAFRARTEILMQLIGGEISRLTDAAVAQTLEAAVRGFQAGALGRAWLLDPGWGGSR